MRKIFGLLLLPLLLSFSEKPAELCVMTFNIRYDHAGDGENAWPHRKDVAAEVVRARGVDLLGMQEVLAHQLNDLKERLPEYRAIGAGREDGKEKGEYSAIMYRADRFEAIDSGWFWLSETPEVAGSKGWDGACERMATWAILKEKKTGRELFFINTHLDHVGKVARSEGVALLLRRTETLRRGLPVILTGDFNATPDTDVFTHVTRTLRDSRSIAQNVTGLRGTFHNFGKIAETERPLIDYVFLTEDFTVQTYETLPEKKDGIYLSDHAPVVAKLAWK